MMFKHLHIGILSVFFFFFWQNQKSFTGHAVGDISIACVCVSGLLVCPSSLAGLQCSPSVFLDISLLCLLVMRAA